MSVLCLLYNIENFIEEKGLESKFINAVIIAGPAYPFYFC